MISFTPRVGISACLLGERCRFDGGHRRLALLEALREATITLVAVCPEVGIGLPTPREKLILVGPAEAPTLLGEDNAHDHGPALRAFAGRFLDEALEEGAGGLHGFVLKARSPSCGVKSCWRRETPGASPVRDGTGLFARALLARLPTLPIIEDTALDDAAACAAFLARVRDHASGGQTR